MGVRRGACERIYSVLVFGLFVVRWARVIYYVALPAVAAAGRWRPARGFRPGSPA